MPDWCVVAERSTVHRTQALVLLAAECGFDTVKLKILLSKILCRAKCERGTGHNNVNLMDFWMLPVSAKQNLFCLATFGDNSLFEI